MEWPASFVVCPCLPCNGPGADFTEMLRRELAGARGQESRDVGLEKEASLVRPRLGHKAVCGEVRTSARCSGTPRQPQAV